MSARDRTVVGVLVALVALAGFWFVGLAPKRKAIAAADTKIAAQQQRLEQAQAIVTAGQTAKRDQAANAAGLARLGTALPADDDVASLVYQLQAVAKGAKVRFKSLKLTPGTGSASTAAPATTTSTTAGAAAASQAAVTSLPPGATVGTAGLPTMPFTFIFEGSFLDMQRFVTRVNDFVKTNGKGVVVKGRLLTVDGISLGHVDSDTSSTVRATISATAYLSPSDSASTSSAGTATGTPGGSSASTGTTNTTSAVVAAPAS